MFKRLQQNDLIGVVCPSFAIDSESKRISSMEKVLIDLGFRVLYGKTVGMKYSYLAGEDDIRAKDIMSMVTNPEVKAILCMLGGYGASRMVDLLNYEVIAKNPKPLIGFSDTTVLLNAIYQKATIPTLHGMLGVFLGNDRLDLASIDDFKSVLMNFQEGRILSHPTNLATTFIPGEAEGILVGGNLSLIHTLMGTPYEIDFTNKIVFIEEVGEDPYRVDRYLSTLRLAGKLDQASGYVFGTFTDCNKNPSRNDAWSAMEVVCDYIKRTGKPTILNFASGHDFPFINLWVGIRMRLDANNKRVTILEEVYEE